MQTHTPIECRSDEDLVLDTCIELVSMAQGLRRMFQRTNEATVAADTIDRMVLQLLEGETVTMPVYRATKLYQECRMYHDNMVYEKTRQARLYPYGR